jgi:hypothetical protein
MIWPVEKGHWEGVLLGDSIQAYGRGVCGFHAIAVEDIVGMYNTKS